MPNDGNVAIMFFIWKTKKRKTRNNIYAIAGMEVLINAIMKIALPTAGTMAINTRAKKIRANVANNFFRNIA